MSDEDDAFEEIVRQIRGGDPLVRETVAQELGKLTVPRGRSGPLRESGADWCVIRVELISGGGREFEPPAGRDFLASPRHTFRQLAEAINNAFARWDQGHLYVFRLADGTMIGTESEELPFREAARTKVGRRRQGEVFEYEFDLGDSWTHRCTILETGVDPEDIYGVPPRGPVAVWGWGDIPDQYGRTTPES